MITGPRSQFENRCRQRGYTLDEVRQCIVAEDGDTITVDETHPAYPRTPKPSPPPLASQAVNFARSAVKHIANGARLCTQDEIDARYAICRACEHFADGACAKCGCPLGREKRFVSKLSWASERCPVGKWGPVDSPRDAND